LKDAQRRSSTRPASRPTGVSRQIGVVDAQQQAVLGARREHPIRLETAARDEIVHENPM
jgi:hypothetical protein